MCQDSSGPQKSGDVHIYVDFMTLNEGLLREVHPLPTVDETLAQLAGATIFNKLDADCDFWQIPLDEIARPLSTFITPFGRFSSTNYLLTYVVLLSASKEG